MTGRRVDWGLGDTMARCSPISALSRVDLPTLGRPARATLPQRVMTANFVEERRRGKASRKGGETRTGAESNQTVLLDACARRCPSTFVLDVVGLLKAGGGLLSHPLAGAVPSALTGLTTVFGMGTGVALSR